MSNNVQITPRKRKPMSDAVTTPGGSNAGKGRTRSMQGPPTPNPPIVPFPTPPSSRHRKDRIPQPVFQPVHPDTPPSTPLKTKKRDKASLLPPHLQTLLTLHHALNLALCLHIATHPPVLPPHAPKTVQLQLTNLTNYLAVKETVERSSGRRFGHAELGRLAWLWSWNGEQPANEAVSEKNKIAEDVGENPFFVSPSSSTPTSTVLSGLTYLISPTRTLDPQTARRVHTYGLGIELNLEPGETRQMLLGGAEGGLGNKGQGGGVRVIGRWSAGGEAREDIVRSRLEKWVELHGGWEPPVLTDLPTPSTSSTSGRTSIPPIPILPLPKLPSSTLLPSANLFSSAISSNTPAALGAGLTSSPSKKLPPPKAITASNAIGGLSDPFVLEEKSSVKGKVVRPGSVEERRLALYERIKARSGGNNGAGATLGSSVSGIRPINLSAAEQQEELKRRSTLSRLEGIAEAVWMMFSAPSSGPSTLSTLPTPPRGKRKVIPLSEVADIVVKSSKTPISTAEAKTSLEMLTQLCPFFLTLKVIAKQEWLEMPTTIIPAPPSPSSSSLDDRMTIGTSLPPSPSSGRGIGGHAMVGVGPASPGRVRRVGGLREVRERIRRELGE